MDAHYFVIGTDGRQYGPISQAEVRTWIADGRVNRYSRARRDTEAQWIALRDMAEFEEETRPPYLGGGGVPDADAGDRVQLREAAVERAYRSEAGDGRIDPVACFKRSSALLASDFWVLGGWTIAVAVVLGGMTLIPRAAVFLGVLLNNILLSALFVLFIGAIRGRRPTVDEVVARVTRTALRLVLGGIVQSILTAPLVFAALYAASTGRQSAAVLTLVVAVPTIYLIVSYAFLLPLIVDRELGIWPALEASRRAVQPQWTQVFGLLVALLLLLFLSALLAGVPLLLTMPLCVGAMMFAYTDLFDRA